MATTSFNNHTLKRQFASYKWARNNTLQILVAATKANIFSFSPQTNQHTVLYQFQCLVTTDDAYYRKLTNHPDIRFGVFLGADSEIKKEDIPIDALRPFLQDNLRRLEVALAAYSDAQFDEHAQTIQSLFSHEYLHQGQLVVLFRQAGVELPERFTRAFDL